MRKYRFRITNVESSHIQEFEPDRDMPGWSALVTAWSLGGRGSGAAIEIDEALEGAKIGIFPASNHVILSGEAASLPEVPVRRSTCGGGSEWKVEDPRFRGPGHVYLRFDRDPLRIGNHVIEMTALEG